MIVLRTHTQDEVASWLDGMQDAIAKTTADRPDFAMIGIRTGGVAIARRLHAALGHTEPLGELNISFYRDDFASVGLHPVVGPSSVPFDIEDRTIVLVDDVLATGRTVRAAMNEIFDFGRPARILLAVLVERRGHELPIRADVAGVRLDLPADEHVALDDDSLTVRIEART